MSATLYLDQSFRPLRIEHWKRAMVDLAKEKVEVISYSEDRRIQGVGREYPMPSVVRVLARFKRDKIRIKFSRLNIYARDRFACQYCGTRLPTEDLDFDHVVPRSRGGRTCWENIVAACRGNAGQACNRRKANRTPEEAGMTLLRRPRKPLWLPSVQVKIGPEDPPEWDYWCEQLDP